MRNTRQTNIIILHPNLPQLNQCQLLFYSVFAVGVADAECTLAIISSRLTHTHILIKSQPI